MVSNKKVAGVIIMHLENGTKKFLVSAVESTIDFIATNITDNRTGLASILEYFKNEVHIELTSIRLVELTNMHTAQENIPLFVFEMEEHPKPTINAGYKWEQPFQIKELLHTYEIEGVPMF